MAQAACNLITRRFLVAAAAAVSSAAVSALPAQAQADPDPIFAAIAAHQAAYRALDQVCRRLSDLEQQIPEAARQEYRVDHIGTDVGANDDPRWKAAMVAYWAADTVETQAAWALARAKPATLKGAAALLRYAHEFEAGGCEWPCEPDDEDGDWNCAFHRSVAAALAALA
jgi:hypothetical protein